MATMNISLPNAMRDYVQERIDDGRYASISDYFRDLVRRDQSGVDDEARWFSDLDASIAVSVAEMQAGTGTDIDAACDAMLEELESVGRRAAR